VAGGSGGDAGRLHHLRRLLASVPVAHAALGTALTVDTPDGRRDAVVVKKPFVDPKKETPKS
jgi:glycine cleavage system aminomethyltransferase T